MCRQKAPTGGNDGEQLQWSTSHSVEQVLVIAINSIGTLYSDYCTGNKCFSSNSPLKLNALSTVWSTKALYPFSYFFLKELVSENVLMPVGSNFFLRVLSSSHLHSPVKDRPETYCCSKNAFYADIIMHLQMHTLSVLPDIKTHAESNYSLMHWFELQGENWVCGDFTLKQLCTFATAQKCQQPPCVSVISLLAHVNSTFLVLNDPGWLLLLLSVQSLKLIF